MEAASDAGELRAELNPRRIAAMTMQTVMFIAQSSGGTDEASVHPISADEVWDFCSRGFVGK
jgi:predicted pyridoxine 5'-phosphate oxidase superfamily flavin-nucleotide-binding protein